MLLLFISLKWYHCIFIAAWFVFKVQHYIPSGKDIDLGDDGPYASYNEARVKSFRKVSNQYPDKDVNISDGRFENGEPFFLITVVVGICEFLFVPWKKD